MRILACIKQEFDFGNMRGLPDWSETIDSFGLVPIANPADLSVLALIRQVFPPDEATITAACVGPAETESILRDALLKGADEAIRIWQDGLDEAFASDPVYVADVLADLAAELEAKIVVCGTRSLSGGSGYVGPAIAERLGFVQVSDVTSLESGGFDCELIARRRLMQGERELVSFKYPAVITVAPGVKEAPYASLPAALVAARTPIVYVDASRLGLDGSWTSVAGNSFKGFVRPRMRTKRLVPDFSSRPAGEILACMMGEGGNVRESKTIAGSVDEVVDGMVDFLRLQGVDLFAQNMVNE